jgi:hypothetical protein
VKTIAFLSTADAGGRAVIFAITAFGGIFEEASGLRPDNFIISYIFNFKPNSYKPERIATKAPRHEQEMSVILYFVSWCLCGENILLEKPANMLGFE